MTPPWEAFLLGLILGALAGGTFVALLYTGMMKRRADRMAALRRRAVANGSLHVSIYDPKNDGVEKMRRYWERDSLKNLGNW